MQDILPLGETSVVDICRACLNDSPGRTCHVKSLLIYISTAPPFVVGIIPLMKYLWKGWDEVGADRLEGTVLGRQTHGLM